MDNLPPIEDCYNFPEKLDSCDAFEHLAECAMNSFAYISCAQNMLLLSESNAETEMAKTLEIIETRYSVFYITQERALENEKKFEDEDAGLVERPDARKVVLLTIFLSRTLAVFVQHRENTFETRTAFDLPDIVKQMIALYDKPIMSYTATELIQALDALSFRWNLDVQHTLDIDRYVYLLSLRFGMFLLWGMPVSAYGEDTKLRKQATRVNGCTEEICAPSRAFFVHATGRIMAFTAMTWHTAQYKETILINDIPQRAQMELASLFLRYIKEGINKVVIPSQFSKFYQGFSLAPGDNVVFTANNRYKRCTIRNMLRLLHGKRFVRYVFRQATQLGPYNALSIAISQLRSTPYSDRSELPFESEIAAFCVMSAILRGKYNVAWIDEFFITCLNHIQSLQSSSLPKIAFLSNTFDVVFNGIRYKTPNIFASLCLWLQIIRSEHNGELSPNCNISDLCNVLSNGEASFAVSNHWMESTTVGTSLYLKRQIEITNKDVLVE